MKLFEIKSLKYKFKKKILSKIKIKLLNKILIQINLVFLINKFRWITSKNWFKKNNVYKITSIL